MHLVLPFANAAGPAAQTAVTALKLPTLERLLRHMAPATAPPTTPIPATARFLAADGDEFSLNPPHEQLLARLRGWPVQDGLLPFAAEAARADGLAPQGATPDHHSGADTQEAAAGSPSESDSRLGWALVSPSHWHLGTEQISLTNPAELDLEEAESRTLFEAVGALFQQDGWALHWGAPSRWYATHASLSEVRSASLDRVIGRNVDWWLNEHPEQRQALRLTRRLQSEVQMLLYGHPLNSLREARGLRPVNSIWLSGTGPTQPPAAATDARLGLRLDDRLRAPALAGDGLAWARAWADLDAGPLAELEAALKAGQPVSLSLCGERSAVTLNAAPKPWWRQLLGAGPARAPAVLASL